MLTGADAERGLASGNALGGYGSMPEGIGRVEASVPTSFISVPSWGQNALVPRAPHAGQKVSAEEFIALDLWSLHGAKVHLYVVVL